MEDNLQLLIYIVFGIIYLIFGALKKRRQGQQPQGPMAPYAEEDPHTVLEEREPRSLEELLERYEQAATRAKRRADDKAETILEQVDEEFIPAVPNQPQYRSLEAEALKQMQETERLKAMQEELPAAARTEILQQQLTEKTRPAKKHRWPAIRVSEHRAKPATTPLLRTLKTTARSRKGMQQAMILSEIFNRKHF